MTRFWIGLPFLLAAGVASAAEPIDLSKPWGNKDGCINRVQQEVYSENMLLLTRERLTTSASACEIERVQAAKDGSLRLSTRCDMEGEPEGQAAEFTVRRAKKKGVLQLLDEDGQLFGEVSRCR